MGARIQDYAIIGDSRSAALVSRDGAIDWLCWPRFDSDAVLAALLDPTRGGTFLLGPATPAHVERRYRGDSHVLETTFHTATGSARVVDAMPVDGPEADRLRPRPEHELLRVVEGLSGEVELELRFSPRPGFARGRWRLRDRGALGLVVDLGRSACILRSDVHLRPGSDGDVRARLRLFAGERHSFSLVFAADGPAVLPPLGTHALERLDRTAAWWSRWASRARSAYPGPFSDELCRSLLVLKLMSYAPSGAIVAAPTTSLPERLHGPLNWDYRFCWLRDAAFTARAFHRFGYQAEGDAFSSWLLHTTRLTQPRLRVLYDVYGEQPPRERKLLHLSGYRGSRPVRVGNMAAGQQQRDVYGEVVSAAGYTLERDGRVDRETADLLVGIGRYVCRTWHLPDHGIWEPREAPAHHTHSRLLSWVALDKLLDLYRKGYLPRLDVAEVSTQRARIRSELLDRAWSPRLGSYVGTLDGEDLDVTALLLPWYRFEPADSPRMRKTWARVLAQLGAGEGFFYRNDDLRARGDGAFGICAFWAVEYLARGGGTLEQAERAFRASAALANDVGLLAEEYDPATGDALGNFPQAYTHVGLVNALLSLQERAEREPRRPPRTGPPAPPEEVSP